MKETQRNFLIGLFLIAGFGALGFLMVMFGETPRWLGGAEYELNIQVREISGIDDGSPVFLNGIKIGRVAELNFIKLGEPDKGVEVTARVKKEFMVPLGASAVCIGPALGVGRGRIEIYAAGGAELGYVPEGGTIMGEMGSAFGEIIPETMMSSLEGTVVKIGTFAEELTPVASDLHELLKLAPISEVDAPGVADKDSTANLYTAVQRLNLILKHIDEVIGDPEVRNGLRTALDNLFTMIKDGQVAVADFRDTSANLKVDAARVAQRFEGAIDTIETRADQLAEGALPILDDTARTSANLRTISDNLVQGKGTLGLLLSDERLYEVMLLSLERLTDMIDSIRRLAKRWEQEGRIRLNLDTAVGPVPVSKELPK